VEKKPSDFFSADAARDYQAHARQSWEVFAGQWQKQFGPKADEFFKSSSTSSPSSNVTIEHALAGLKSYADWMQSAAAGASAPQGDWQQQLHQLFGGASQPFFQGPAAADSSAKAYVDQWQSWLDSLRKGATDGVGQSPVTGFGFGHEQQAQQQALAAAINQHLEASQRYQALMQRSNAHAMEKMQARLAKLAAPGSQIESLKVLYDLWVDCAEEAYAEIALSDEFREAYGEMVNTQVRVRQLQQEQAEYVCRQLGIPTRSDISSLGERMHSLRREMRDRSATAGAPAADSHAQEIAVLRREVAALRRALSAGQASVFDPKSSSVGKVAAKPKRSAVKTAVTQAKAAKPPKVVAKKAAEKSKPRAAAESKKAVRKRK